MKIVLIVLGSIVGVLILIGLGIVIHDLRYYRQEDKKK